MEGAKRFYGSVFGWKTLDLGGGAEMWRLPGYRDYLEQRDRGLGERMAESGGPEGSPGDLSELREAIPEVEDVVATLNPIADDQPGSCALERDVRGRRC